MSDTQYQRILAKFRSQADFCRITGIKQTTVSSWRERGLIPSEHHETIIRKARASNIKITPADFFAADIANGAAA